MTCSQNIKQIKKQIAIKKLRPEMTQCRVKQVDEKIKKSNEKKVTK